MSAGEQARFFLAMALCGASCSAACDALALGRCLLRGGRLATAVCDAAGGVAMAAAMTAVGLRFGLSPFRLYAFAGAGLGFALWQGTAGLLLRRAGARMVLLGRKNPEK